MNPNLVYNYKTIFLSQMQHMTIYHGLSNYKMIVLFFYIYHVLLLCLGCLGDQCRSFIIIVKKQLDESSNICTHKSHKVANNLWY